MSGDTVLNLWKKDLGSVPSDVWEQTEVTTLILADNGLTEISGKLDQLQCLRTLDLGHNRISVLPESLGDLTELSDFLYLHDNRLETLPLLSHASKPCDISTSARTNSQSFLL